MGQRASLIIAGGGGGYELFYTHWRANTLDRDLFWGPDPAIAFVRRQRSAADGADWLDEIWVLCPPPPEEGRLELRYPEDPSWVSMVRDDAR